MEININKLVKDGVSIAGDPSEQVKKAKGKKTKQTPEQIVKGII